MFYDFIAVTMCRKLDGLNTRLKIIKDTDQRHFFFLFVGDNNKTAVNNIIKTPTSKF